MTNTDRVPVEMTVATPPWFGSCERCAEPKSELGTYGPEVIGRLTPTDPYDGWLCLNHLAEAVREVVISALSREVLP